MAFLDKTGLERLWSHIVSKISAVVEANAYVHPSSGVSAGTYTKVTVDDNGHVTAAAASHASSAQTYGVGGFDVYGHVKLAPYINSELGISDGTAATPSAVKMAYDLADSKAAKSNSAMVSVYPEDWTGDAAPYTATVACDLVTSSNNVFVGLASIATATQLATARKALIHCTSQGTGKVTLTANGVKPDRFLPIRIMVVG